MLLHEIMSGLCSLRAYILCEVMTMLANVGVGGGLFAKGMWGSVVLVGVGVGVGDINI